jgi:aspartate/methionine/tyrosine aminotransferase
MSSIEQRFAELGTDHAPGQEVRNSGDLPDSALRGEQLPGTPVDFSHGDVNDDAFAPAPGALDEFLDGVRRGSSQAYTEYRGGAELREDVATKLASFTGRPVSGANELIITPGTQGALFLALGATVSPGDRVAIVRPDYFANRKLVTFLGAVPVPVRMDYLVHTDRAGLDLGELEDAFKSGVRTFLFSNPNNPAGVIYSPDEIASIAALATRHGATVIVDQLYSRLVYPGHPYGIPEWLPAGCRLWGLPPDRPDGEIAGRRLAPGTWLLASRPANLVCRAERVAQGPHRETSGTAR